MKTIHGGITAVTGISTAVKKAGIKKNKEDLVVIFSSKSATAAGVFTTNKVKAAPVLVSKDNIKNNTAQAIIVNSGVANACTGKKGLSDAKKTTKLVSSQLNIKSKDVIVLSTGLIGAYLPIGKIKRSLNGIGKQLQSTKKSGSLAAKAIMTTDTVKKEFAVKVGKITIAGIAKGAGMINPNMATMLSCILTDAKIGKKQLKTALSNSVGKSFNMLSIDGDTSTNDSVVLLANGLKGKISIAKFQKALDFVCITLAKMIAKDGEGATKLFEVNVKKAKTKTQAEIAARSVVSSDLVKCAIHGNDPNWGRIICALGYSDAIIDESKVSISIGNSLIVKNGLGITFNKQKVVSELKKNHVHITISLNQGKMSASAFGCDLTKKYIEINAEYHT